MIVTPVVKSITLPPPSVPRGKGIHISGLIRGIAIEMGILKGDTSDDARLADVREITEPTAVLRICIGLAWEEFYINNILTRDGVVKHPGETRVDGIYMTSDGESLDVVNGKHFIRIHEVKATYKSAKTVADMGKNWMWLAQMKAYCVGAQTRFARLHVLLLCGDYKMPIRPMLQCWDIEFTQKEIDDNWDLLKSYRDQRT